MLLYTPPKVATHIPVIDLAPSFANDAGRTSVAHEIHKAARENGFFYVANHGIERTFGDGVFAQAKRFFALPDERKRSVGVAGKPGTRGYAQLGGQTLDAGSPPDLKEAFNFAADLTPDHPAMLHPAPDFATNQWPRDLPGFREQLMAYYTPMCALGLHLMALIARSLDMPDDFFADAYRYANPSLRLHRYPPQPKDAAFNQLGAGAHTDWGVITLLLQDERGGLEVQNAAGEWLQARPIPDTFVVNLGDMIARWTNGLYHSNSHRVLNNASGSDRYSMALFYNPQYETRVSCLPTCLPPDGVPRWPECTAGEHIAEMRRRSHAGYVGE